MKKGGERRDSGGEQEEEGRERVGIRVRKGGKGEVKRRRRTG